MKWRVVTENVVDLDWDHVEWTEDGKEWLLEWTSGDGYDEEPFLTQLGETKEWMAFADNWLTHVLLAAKEESHVGNLSGTLWFGFDHEGVAMIETDPRFVTMKIGYVGYTTSEDVPLREKAETFIEGGD